MKNHWSLLAREWHDRCSVSTWLGSNLQCIFELEDWAIVPSSLFIMLYIIKLGNKSKAPFRYHLIAWELPISSSMTLYLTTWTPLDSRCQTRKVCPKLFHMFITYPSLNEPATPRKLDKTCLFKNRVWQFKAIFLLNLTIELYEEVIWRFIRHFHTMIGSFLES